MGPLGEGRGVSTPLQEGKKDAPFVYTRMDVRMLRVKAVEITLLIWITNVLPKNDVARAASREYPLSIKSRLSIKSSEAWLTRAVAHARS